MRQRQKNLFIVAGVISTIVGLAGGIPAFASGRYSITIGATGFLVLGIILIAVGLGD